MAGLLSEEREALLEQLVLLFPSRPLLDIALQKETEWSLGDYPETERRDGVYIQLLNDMANRNALIELRGVVASNAGRNPVPVDAFDEVLQAIKMREARPKPVLAAQAQQRQKTGRRRVAQTILHCRIAIDPAGPNETHAARNQRFEEAAARMAGRLSGAMEGAVMQDDGFLARFLGPADAVKSALRMQRAILKRDGEPFDANARISFGLSQAELFRELAIPVGNASVAVAGSLAQLAEHQQVLVTGTVFDSVSGNDFNLPAVKLGRANHGDYSLNGMLVRVCEFADRTLREPAAPAGGEAAQPAQRMLEDAGFHDLEPITRTGTSVIYFGRHPDWDFPLAIKVLIGGQGIDSAMREAFLAIPRLLLDIRHDGIIQVLKIAENDLAYFVMEWIDGNPLDMPELKFGEEQSYQLALALCDALSAAHEAGILHGDIKPANILVRSRTNIPVLIDFGSPPEENEANSESLSAAVHGTAQYLAPELIQPDASQAVIGPMVAGQRADIYSLGLVLYELFVGHSAFTAKGRQAILMAHVTSDPRLPRSLNPLFDPGLEAVLLTALERNPDTRYQTIAQLRDELARVAKGIPPRCRPTIYDNAMLTRASAAVAEVNAWGGNLTVLERNRLLRAYDPLLRSGPAAIGESRLMHLPIMMLYVFGALLVSGLTILLTGHADIFGNDAYAALSRILVGLVPPALTGALWFVLSRRRRLRAAFVLGVLTVTALPLAVTNTLHELLPHLTSYSVQPGKYLFGRALDAENNAILQQLGLYSNWQIALGLLAGLIWAALVSQRSRTLTMAVVSALLLSGLLLVVIDLWGWQYFFSGHRDALGLTLVIMAPICFFAPHLLRGTILPAMLTTAASRQSRRANDNEWRRLTPPFVVAASLFLVVGATLYAWFAADVLASVPWAVDDGLIFLINMEESDIIRGLLFAGAGILFYLAGQYMLERWFPHVVFTIWMLTYLGLAYLLAGLLFADSVTPTDDLAWWPFLGDYGFSLGLVMAIAVVAFTLHDSVRTNSRGLMATGLAMAIIVAWYVEVQYFKNDPTWALVLLAVSAMAFAFVCARFSLDREGADIDDVVQRSIRPPEIVARTGTARVISGVE